MVSRLEEMGRRWGGDGQEMGGEEMDLEPHGFYIHPCGVLNSDTTTLESTT